MPATASSSAAEASALRVTAYRKIGMRLIPLLFLAYVFNFLDRVNVGFAHLQMGTDLGLSAAVFGLGAGIFFIGYFLFEIPSNLLLEKYGARFWIARIMVTWGVLSACTMFVQTAWQFYLIRFILGIAEAGFFPGVILYLTYWYTNTRRAKATAFFFTATAAAGVVGGPLSGVILESLNGAGGLAGWQWLFLIEGLPAALIGIFILAFLPSTPEKASWLSAAEKAAVRDELDSEAAAKPVHGTWTVMKDKRVLLLCVIYFCFVLGSYGIAFWLPQVIEASGVHSPLQVGLLSAIPWSAAVVAMVLGARSSDRTRKRRLHVGGAALLGALGLTVVTVGGGSVAVTIIGLSLAAAGVYTALPLFWSLPTAFLTAGAAAVGLATINSVGNLGGFAANFAMGWAVEVTGSTALATAGLAACLVLGVVLMTRIPGALADR